MKKAMIYFITAVMAAIMTLATLEGTSVKVEATETVNTMADVVRALVYENDNYTMTDVLYDDGEVQIYFYWDIMAHEKYKEAFHGNRAARVEIDQQVSNNYLLSEKQVHDYLCDWHIRTLSSYKPYYSLMVGFG